MSDLKTNLEEILQEKETKIIPANIKKDIQIFDVVGTYEGEGASDLNNLDLLIPDMIWMNSISINDSPDIRLVENIFNELSTTESGDYSKTMQLVSTGFSETLSQSLIFFSIERSNNNRYFNLTLQDVLSEETYKSIMYISLDLLDQGIKINGISDELLTSVTETGWYIISSTGDSLTKADTTYISELEQGFSDKGYITQVNYGRKYGSILSALNSFVTINLSEKLNDFGSTDAIASDILKDKKAFANGSFITGTYEPGDDISNYINLNPTGTSLRFTSLITKVPEIDTSSITNMSNAFSGYSGLKEISLLNTSNVTNMYRMFYQCNNLTTIPQIDTSKVTNMESMFDGCSNLTTIPEINTSKVTNMESMFDNCSKLTTIPQIDTSKTKTTERMFFSCRKLTTIPQLDMSNNITMNQMFNYCESLVSISLINTSNVTNMSNAFSGCSSLTTIIGLDTSNATNIYGLFGDCSSLTTIPEINTSSATTTGYMFKGCSNLTTIPEINTSKVQDMNYMFSDCTSLTTIPQIDTSKVENMSYMFDGCSKLETVPMINTSSVTNMYQMFRNCTNLTTIPEINTSNVTKMDYMFNFCNNLTTIPQLNMNNVSSMSSMFNDCVNLSNDSLNNILASLLTATSYTGTKTLNRIGLSSTQATTCTTLSNWSACEAAGWTTGY